MKNQPNIFPGLALFSAGGNFHVNSASLFDRQFYSQRQWSLRIAKVEAVNRFFSERFAINSDLPEKLTAAQNAQVAQFEVAVKRKMQSPARCFSRTFSQATAEHEAERHFQHGKVLA